MRTTGTPLGRVGRPPRLDQGVIRNGDRGREHGSSRRAGRAARALFRPDSSPNEAGTGDDPESGVDGLFASEPKGILAHPDVQAEVDLDGLR